MIYNPHGHVFTAALSLAQLPVSSLWSISPVSTMLWYALDGDVWLYPEIPGVFGYVWFKTTPQQSSDDTDDEPEVHIALNRMMTFEAFV